jgi:hypothetical protein
MTISEFLRQGHSESMPQWLANAEPGMTFPRADFFSSRVVYYPGARFDGQAVQIFGSGRAAHCFVYVDFDYTLPELHAELNSERNGFRGYHSIARVNVAATELRETPWHPRRQLNYGNFARRAMANPFALLEILERNSDFGDDHGPNRLAVLFIAACGFATFDALFNQSPDYRPYAILLQDHGFGGCPDEFGAGGLLEDLSAESAKHPKFMLIGQNTTPWNGYRQIEGLPAEPGGMHAFPRRLYVQEESA